MKVTSLDFSIAEDLGLRPGKMGLLGQLVVLAGPNGAGKSRILTFVERVLSNRGLVESPEQIEQQLHSFRRSTELRSLNETLLVQRRSFEQLLSVARAVQVEPAFEPNRVAHFVPLTSALKDHRSLTEQQQEQAEERLRQQVSGEDAGFCALSYIARVERRCFNVTHPRFQSDTTLKERAVADQHRLGDLLEALLGARPELDVNQQPRLFGFPIGEANLSAGQSILLQLAVALHAQGSRLNGLVLLLDEPECHLHPSALVEVVNRLCGINELGQLWIATHNVPLLAEVPPESIWFVDQGSVSWAGREPEIVLQGLLGGPEGAERLGDFLRLPAQLAANRFAAECLISPKVADTGSDDPQAAQVRQVLATAAEQGETLKVLDYGAGVGRLLSALHERWAGDRPFQEAIDYRAFEPYPKDQDKLRARIEAIYGIDSTMRLITREDELSMLDPQSVDVVVLCNVLHEIPPERWCHLFGSKGILPRVLEPDGRLLILEDQEIPHGEKAHRFGFLLLDETHLHTLLGRTEKDPRVETTKLRDGRLAAHVIRAEILGRTKRQHVSATLEALRKTAIRNIETIRQKDVDSRSGREHALWTQLLANAQLGLEVLREK